MMHSSDLSVFNYSELMNEIFITVLISCGWSLGVIFKAMFAKIFDESNEAFLRAVVFCLFI